MRTRRALVAPRRRCAGSPRSRSMHRHLHVHEDDVRVQVGHELGRPPRRPGLGDHLDAGLGLEDQPESARTSCSSSASTTRCSSALRPKGKPRRHANPLPRAARPSAAAEGGDALAHAEEAAAACGDAVAPRRGRRPPPRCPARRPVAQPARRASSCPRVSACWSAPPARCDRRRGRGSAGSGRGAPSRVSSTGRPASRTCAQSSSSWPRPGAASSPRTASTPGDSSGARRTPSMRSMSASAWRLAVSMEASASRTSSGLCRSRAAPRRRAGPRR